MRPILGRQLNLLKNNYLPKLMFLFQIGHSLCFLCCSSVLGCRKREFVITRKARIFDMSDSVRNRGFALQFNQHSLNSDFANLLTAKWVSLRDKFVVLFLASFCYAK